MPSAKEKAISSFLPPAPFIRPKTAPGFPVALIQLHSARARPQSTYALAPRNAVKVPPAFIQICSMHFSIQAELSAHQSAQTGKTPVTGAGPRNTSPASSLPIEKRLAPTSSVGKIVQAATPRGIQSHSRDLHTGPIIPPPVFSVKTNPAGGVHFSVPLISGIAQARPVASGVADGLCRLPALAPTRDLTGLIQRASPSMKRPAFTAATRKAVEINPGEHRRHIISAHVMKWALEAWAVAHRGEISQGDMQELLKDMNNKLENLIPGEGKANTAIGMFTNAAERKLASAVRNSATPAQIATSLGKYSGFQQATQHTLIGPAIAALTSDSSLSSSSAAAQPYVVDLIDSTDFDWPEGADPSLFQQWHDVYISFISLRKNAAAYSKEGLRSIVKSFMVLPKPTK